MTTNNKNVETTETKSATKQLIAIIQDGNFDKLIKSIDESKRMLDDMLNAYRKERDALDKKRREELAVQAAAKAPPPVKQKVVAPKVEQEKTEVKKPAVSEKPATSTVRKKEILQPSYVRGYVEPTPTQSPQPRAPKPQRDNGTAQSNVVKKPILPRPTLNMPPINSGKDRRQYDKKKDTKAPEDKRGMNKRTLIRKGFIPEDFDEERMGTRKLKNKKAKEPVKFTPIKIEKAVITTENLTVKILSEKIGKTAQEIIKQLMILGIMTNINSVVDFPTMELVANELGVELELKLDKSTEALVEEEAAEVDDEKDLVKRPPVITVMGHVDHGKTSLLDAIRKTTVASGEAGGITQAIGAYSVSVKGERITFLDTPGHEAFTEMRARGAKVTDIAVLVVAADDGIMPQTVEAINHAKAAEVPIIVAVNKMDKAGANPDKIKQSLTEYGLVCEEWGGDTMIVPISAKTGMGIDKLLETILFLAEYNNYRANPNRKAKASIIEAKLDKGKGPIANVIVMNGTLRVGDHIVSGYTSGRIRAMVDDKGRNVKEAGPSVPVSILGFADVPNAGDTMNAVADEKTAKQVVAERTARFKTEQANQNQKVTLDDVFNKISEGSIKELNVLIKADVQGSVEALKTSLMKLTSDEVRVNVVHGGVGAINKSDLMLADVSHAIIIGFNVRPDNESKALAEQTGVDIRLYRVIYEAIDDVELAMKGMLAPKYQEVILGRAQVRNIFKISGAGQVAGSYVLSGKMVRGAKVRVFRGEEIVYEGSLNTLRRFKDDVKEVATGYECGIGIDFNDVAENDEIEAYDVEVVK